MNNADAPSKEIKSRQKLFERYIFYPSFIVINPLRLTWGWSRFIHKIGLYPRYSGGRCMYCGGGERCYSDKELKIQRIENEKSMKDALLSERNNKK